LSTDSEDKARATAFAPPAKPGDTARETDARIAAPTPEEHLRSRRLWGASLRLIISAVALGLVMLSETQTGLLRLVFALYLPVAMVGCVLVWWNVAGGFRTVLYLVLDVAVVTFTVYGLGAQASPFVAFYIPLVIGYSLQGGRRIGLAALLLSLGSYGSVLVLEHLELIRHAPVYFELPPPGTIIGGAPSAFAAAVIALVSTYIFLGYALRRIERYGEMRQRLAVAEQRARLLQQFSESQRLESLGRLARGVAHDFNNLLTAIDGYAGITMAKVEMEQADRTRLEEIRNTCERGSELVRQMLNFSRKQASNPAAVEVNEVLDDMEDILRQLVGKKVELVLSPGENVGPVWIDPAHMEQIILNLVVNARDATPDGGRIAVATRPTIKESGTSRRSWVVQPGPYVMFGVSDTGCGMDEATREQIFEPFFTTKEADKGTGLGMSTVYGLIKQYSGDIEVESEPGRGTTITILLPRHDAAEA